MTQTTTTTTGLPEILAFIVTLFIVLGCGIYASAIATKEGKLRANQIGYDEKCCSFSIKNYYYFHSYSGNKYTG